MKLTRGLPPLIVGIALASLPMLRANSYAQTATSNAASAPNASSTAKDANTTKDAKSTKNAGVKPAAPANAPTAQEIADAKEKGLVWVNLGSKVYHKEGKFYGKTKRGKFMTEDDAKKAGYHEARETAATAKAKVSANPASKNPITK